jgi:hypothetical protein
MAKEKEIQLVGDILTVTLEIPLKGGPIKIKGIPPIPKEGLSKIPIKKLNSLEGIHILRYEGSYCVVIEFMGSYYIYCI